MGPYATNFFKANFRSNTGELDKDHFHTIIDNNVKIPSRTRAVKYNEQQPVIMVNSINNLAKIGWIFNDVTMQFGALFYNQVSEKIKIPWLNMIHYW